MKVGWLVDEQLYVGGAELTQDEFRKAAPEAIEIVDCPKDGVVEGLDAYVIQNAVTYDLSDLEPLTGRVPVYKMWHDVGSWWDSDVRTWIDAHATPICCSPMQAEYMGLDRPHCVPPAVPLDRFYAAAASVNGDRRGAVSVGSWRNLGKGARSVVDWGAQNNGIDTYGSGPFAPPGSRQVAYAGMPKLLAKYRTFVFLPTVIEPFGRAVAEAWAAGCEIVTNGLVGARWWIENDWDAVEHAGERFWEVVTS
jgi:glycosyltransferase involved in cell wall biosynthesis